MRSSHPRLDEVHPGRAASSSRIPRCRSDVAQNVPRGHSRGNQYSGRCRVSTAHTRASALEAVALTCGSKRSIAAFSLTCQSACGPSPRYGRRRFAHAPTLAAALSSLAACPPGRRRVRATARCAPRGLCSREPEGRRRQDDDRRQPRARASPRRASACSSSTSTRRRTRRRGSACARTARRRTIFSTACR